MVWGHIALKFEYRCPIIALNARVENTFGWLINGISVHEMMLGGDLVFFLIDLSVCGKVWTYFAGKI